MQWLKDFINGFFGYLIDCFKWLAEAIGEVISFVAFTIYDGLLTVIFLFADTVDLSAVAFNMAAQYSGLPTQLIWLINEVNLPQSTSYIAGAIVIRMILNIIPAAVTRI
jgi:zinc transporter ZupT